MRKTDKKIENQLRRALTSVCEIALKEIDGFQWLTHLVNYGHFPKSLKIIFVFDTEENLRKFKSDERKEKLTSLTQAQLREISVDIKNLNNHLSYDTEESCLKEHNGKWADRLSNYN